MASTQKKSALDIGRQRLGQVYAKALLGVTQAAGNTAAVLEELDSLVDDVLDRSPQLDAILSAPRVPVEEKQKLLDKAFSGRMNKQLLSFLQVVGQHGRLDCLRSIRVAARRLYNELTQKVEATVTTATALSSELLGQVTARLKASLGREVELQQATDPDLIGGVVVQIGDRVVDGSVANRLKQLRTQAIERAALTIREKLPRFVSET